MQTEYYREYSPSLGRDMEIKRYGHAGRPVLFIPCQDGRFYDFENFHMTDAWAPWIDSGRAMVFSIDTIDRETWSDKGGDPHWRIRRHEQWMDFITREAVPFIRGEANRLNGWEGYPGIIAFGCSLGALHAANLFFRFPDLFDGCWPSAASTPPPTALTATWTRRSTATPLSITWPECRRIIPTSSATTRTGVSCA